MRVERDLETEAGKTEDMEGERGFWGRRGKEDVKL